MDMAQKFSKMLESAIKSGKVKFTTISDDKESEKGRTFCTVKGNIAGCKFVINVYEPSAEAKVKENERNL